jgi:hypothetical protein
MQNRYFAMLILLLSLPPIVLANAPLLSNPTSQNAKGKTRETINLDGNLSLSPQQNSLYWNPHSVGLTTSSHWQITFNNQTEMHLETTANESGHIAMGAWWTTSFKTKQKIPLYTASPVQIAVSFNVNLVNASLHSGNEWLRIALACAVQRIDSSVVYTEMDLWDSPSALVHPSGNIQQGGNIIYKGGDVVEYKIDQLSQDQWRSYQLDLTSCINNAWQLKPGDLLESVYFVVETGGAVNVTLRAGDLQIALLT